MTFAVITGGGSGIGQALTWALAEKGVDVLIAGRREEKLKETQQKFPNKITYCVADIGTPAGRDQLINSIGDRHIDYLVHNAGTAQPYKSVQHCSYDEWRHTMAINVEAPVFLTQALINHLQPGGRVLHLSSGAAYSVLPGMSVYSISKATLLHLWKAWTVELSDYDIAFGSVQPGLIDTDMTNTACDTDAKQFAGQKMFAEWRDRGMFLSPAVTAKFIGGLLLDKSAEEFASKDWNIYDELDEMSSAPWEKK